MFFKYCYHQYTMIVWNLSDYKKQSWMPKPISFDRGIVLLFDLIDMLHGLINSSQKGRQISVST